MKNIYSFKKGDLITRIAPAKEYGPEKETIFGTIGGVRDRSYMGLKLIFVGIANGQIYIKFTDAAHLSLYGDRILGMALDIFDEGWDNWVDPEKLFNSDVIYTDKTAIEAQIKKAEESEDYELAAKLKKQLEI